VVTINTPDEHRSAEIAAEIKIRRMTEGRMDAVAQIWIADGAQPPAT